MLSKIGYNVYLSEHGKDAIEMLKKNVFDLVLMDVQMPLMDGIETTRIIRNKLKLKLPIIGLSANIYKDEIDKCLNAGMNDYLSKLKRLCRKKFINGHQSKILKHYLKPVQKILGRGRT